jgi:hypothetical protein
MTEPQPPISATSLPTGLAHGVFADDRWTFSGAAPEAAARIDIQTDRDTSYSVSCDETHWTLALKRGDRPTAVAIHATAIDGTLVVREGCLLSNDDRYQPNRVR